MTVHYILSLSISPPLYLCVFAFLSVSVTPVTLGVKPKFRTVSKSDWCYFSIDTKGVILFSEHLTLLDLICYCSCLRDVFIEETCKTPLLYIPRPYCILPHKFTFSILSLIDFICLGIHPFPTSHVFQVSSYV